MALMVNHRATHKKIPNTKCNRVLTVLGSSTGYSKLYRAVAAEILAVRWSSLPAKILAFVSPFARIATLIQCHALALSGSGWPIIKRV